MSRMCDKNSSEKVLHVSNKQSKPTDETFCSAKKLTAGPICNETDGHCKRKRLKTRKERSQVRGGWKDTSRTKYHHHCHCQIRKDMAYFQNSCQRTSKKTAPISSAVAVAQEPSIITDNRLIGHHGLFNHEVKSIDIERLLSEQSKYDKSRQQVKEKPNNTSHLSSSSHIHAQLSSDGLLAVDVDDVQFKKKADPAAKSHGGCQEAEEKNLQLNKQGSDITPGQRPQQHLDLSSGSFKSILSSKHSSNSVEITKTKNTNHVVSKTHTQSQLTPFDEKDNAKTSNINAKRHMTSATDQPHKNKDHQAQRDGFNPNPLQVSSSSTADSGDIQHKRQDPACASKSVTAVATGLCESLYFPLLKKRNLVSEIREVLLKSLQEKQGPLLQANLLEVQKCIRFGIHPAQAVRNQEPVMMEEDVLLSTDAPPRNRHFDWKSTPQLHQSLQQTTEWLENPVDELLRPDVSPELYLDFESSKASPCHFFVRSPTLCSGGRASAFDHWEKSLKKSKSKESVLFDSFKNSFIDNTAEIEESSFGRQYHYNNIQPFFPYQAEFQDGYSAVGKHLVKEQDAFVADRYSLAPSYPAQIYQPPQSSYIQPFSQYSQPLAFPTLRSHHIDMMHYPPSHMLDRSPAPAPSSFPSPEQWSFPRMRLY
ncbi:uncharacterized protein si:dkey-250k15.4 isoform X2 [Melanotaenia boesemani]|uniref:uncharacterized protein si:dkey-250k15.4 isoform X2 n=1 Tax=Melanotaenia boesemani TaxID=1250792 RepID=UPI001C04A4F7|nr:uncharacterized protein si:dkey-250k15.4 isoform X2 [Melanotaenia boesemani]